MARPRNPVPSYLHHKATGRARMKVGGKYIYLGEYGSAKSKKEYRRLCAELETRGADAVLEMRTPVTSVAEVAERYYAHALSHYRDVDGNLTTEVQWIKSSLDMLFDLYGHVPVAEFGPKALKAIRQQWVKHGLCRRTVNARVDRVRRMFKWAASEELVPGRVYHDLLTVAGLRAGRTEAHDHPPVEPVPNLHLAVTLVTMPPTLRAMVLVQRLSGMRPGEVCRMKVCQVDRSSLPWLYTPRLHKTSYRGKQRPIHLGPVACEVLQPFLDGVNPDSFVFRPAAVELERNPGSSACRQSACYTVNAYSAAVRRASIAAGVPKFAPHRLRHSFATEIREAFGLEAAQVMLGHSKADVTERYAERDMNLGARVAARVG